MIMDTNKLLKDFRDFKISLEELKTAFGVTRLLNEKVDNPLVITASDVVAAIKRYRSEEISVLTLVNWVNTLWFNYDLYAYSDDSIDSIASVMDLLEEFDEKGVSYTDSDYDRMVHALETNSEFKL
jgi:hypothetical protein